MRPHSDATPVLLVAVALLFVLILITRVYDLLLPAPPRPDPRGPLQVRGREVLDQARRALVLQREVEGRPLGELLGDPSLGSVGFSVPVSASALPEGVVLRAGRVQGEAIPGPPFRVGDLPHAGVLRLEATFLPKGGGEPRWRSVERVGYRLARLAPPPPFGKRCFLLLEPAGLLDREPGPPLASARADLAEAEAELEKLGKIREQVRPGVVSVATQFVEYVHGFRHLDGPNVDPPELVAARWLQELPGPVPVGEASQATSLLATGAALATRWETVDLARWAGVRRWVRLLLEARAESRQKFELAWGRWRGAVAESFRLEAWESVGTSAELRSWIQAVETRLRGHLRDLGTILRTWEDRALRSRRTLLEVGEFFEVLPPAETVTWRQAMEAWAPEVWRPQASAVFEGVDAATRCGQYLEGATGPFARETEGVIFVDNAGGPPLELGELTFPGRLVVVATGEVRLWNLGPRDSRRHRLVVVAAGRLTLRGRVRAFVASLGGLTMAPDTHLVGGMVLDAVRPEDSLAGRVEWDPLPEELGEGPRLEVFLEGESSGEE